MNEEEEGHLESIMNTGHTQMIFRLAWVVKKLCFGYIIDLISLGCLLVILRLSLTTNSSFYNFIHLLKRMLKEDCLKNIDLIYLTYLYSNYEEITHPFILNEVNSSNIF